MRLELNRFTLLMMGLMMGSLTSLGCDDQEPTAQEAGAEAGADVGGGQAGSSGEAGGHSAGAIGGSEALARYQGVTLNELVSKGTPSDWVELYNSSDLEVDLSGCGLSDDPSDPLKGRLAEGLTIPAQGFLLIPVSDETLGFKLGSAETVSLSTPSGLTLDEVSYADGQSPAGGAYGRLPDGVGDWETLYTQTPGAPNERGSEAVCGDLTCAPSEGPEVCPEDCVSCGDGLCDPSELGVCEEDCPSLTASDVLINEVLASGSPDWVELYNLSEVAIDLTGYGLSDDLATPFKATLSDLTLPARGYLVVLVSDETLGFKLGGDELATLTSPEGLLIDLVDWDEGDAPEGMTWGRSPDGGDAWATLTPTPGAENGEP